MNQKIIFTSLMSITLFLPTLNSWADTNQCEVDTQTYQIVEKALKKGQSWFSRASKRVDQGSVQRISNLCLPLAKKQAALTVQPIRSRFVDLVNDIRLEQGKRASLEQSNREKRQIIADIQEKAQLETDATTKKLEKLREKERKLAVQISGRKSIIKNETGSKESRKQYKKELSSMEAELKALEKEIAAAERITGTKKPSVTALANNGDPKWSEIKKFRRQLRKQIKENEEKTKASMAAEKKAQAELAELLKRDLKDVSLDQLPCLAETQGDFKNIGNQGDTFSQLASAIHTAPPPFEPIILHVNGKETPLYVQTAWIMNPVLDPSQAIDPSDVRREASRDEVKTLLSNPENTILYTGDQIMGRSHYSDGQSRLEYMVNFKLKQPGKNHYQNFSIITPHGETVDALEKRFPRAPGR